ncbi:hypothetical protein C8Q77DRAFT_1216780 [Trametes polyzona]|nr:hypothetical protein C8Q77DRAFT_1216780 [Trametes polyzona]
MQVDTAELAGLAAEGVLYGILVCMSCVRGHDLLERRARFAAQVNWQMVLAGVLLIVLATARFAVDTANIFAAFIHHDPRGARISYLDDVTQPLFASQYSLLIAILLVGNSFQNYRCWIMWDKSIWSVLLPVCLSFASAAVGSYATWAYNTSHQDILSTGRWLKAFLALSLVANACSSLTLAIRFWSTSRRHVDSSAGTSRLQLILRSIIESGTLNAAYLFVYTMLLAFDSSGLPIVSEMAVPFTGVVFSIVILHAGRRQRTADSVYTRRPVVTGRTSWTHAKGSRGERSTTGASRSTITEDTTQDMPLEVYMQRSNKAETVGSNEEIGSLPSMVFSNEP